MVIGGQVDRLVYRFYDLSLEEVRAIGPVGKWSMRGVGDKMGRHIYSFSDALANLAIDITGVEESIEILINDNDIDFLNYIYDCFILADQRLNLRMIITYEGEKNHPPPTQLKEFINDILEYGWKVSRKQKKYSANILIIDGEISYIFVKDNNGYLIDKIRGNATKKEIRFLLHNTIKDENLILFEDILFSSISQNSKKIIAVSTERWSEIIAKLAVEPEGLIRLASRRFEELVAELLIREGMRVYLTPPTKDGGIDIFAETDTIFGKHLYLVECKRYAKTNPVGVSIVRALYGVIEDQNATKGVIVTTSDFTKGAKNFNDLHKNRMDLRNYDSLVRWLANAGGKK
jgi:HJR/Mrr/RecB family endonuclease